MVADVTGYVRQHAVLMISVVLAVVSCLFVPPDAEYADYLHGRTLMSLFAMMAVIKALDDLHVVGVLAERVVRHLRTRRTVVTALVALTMVAAMLVTNDMALLTMLPLTWVVLRTTDNVRYTAFVFVMQAAAANLGGMITPFGSPHNLYLYQRFQIPIHEFVAVMAIPFALSVVMVIVPCLLIPDAPIEPVRTHVRIRRRRALVLLALFLVTIALVLRILPVWAGLVVPLVLLFLDPRALRRVDYALLATFVAFFVFSGNLARADGVQRLLSDVLSDHVMLWSAGASQIISNVPASIVFSHFTDDWRQLLVGVNVGGVGTIVASLASLIALRQYEHFRPGRSGEFMRLFTIVNVILLVVLLAVMEAVFASGLL